MNNLIKLFIIICLPVILLSQGTWVSKAPMLTNRTSMPGHGVVIDDKIYIGCGFDGVNALSTIEVFNPQTDSWSIETNMPATNSQCEMVSIGHKIYILGGAIDFPEATNTLYEYDVITGQWSQKAPMSKPRKNFAADLLHGKIYAFGGSEYYTQNNQDELASVEVYDPETDTWTFAAEMPEPRASHAVAVLNAKAYILGGSDWVDGSYKNIAEIDVYDPNLDSWERLNAKINTRFLLAASASSGKIYAIGGAGFEGSSQLVEEFNPANNEIREVTSMPTGRSSMSAVNYHNAVYVIGGRSAENPSNFVEAYIPDGVSAIEEDDEDFFMFDLDINIFPNPTTDIFTLEYSLERNGNVKIFLTDIPGKFIGNISDVFRVEGDYSIDVDLDEWELKSGVYLLNIEVNGKKITKKIIRY